MEDRADTIRHVPIDPEEHDEVRADLHDANERYAGAVSEAAELREELDERAGEIADLNTKLKTLCSVLDKLLKQVVYLMAPIDKDLLNQARIALRQEFHTYEPPASESPPPACAAEPQAGGAG